MSDETERDAVLKDRGGFKVSDLGFFLGLWVMFLFWPAADLLVYDGEYWSHSPIHPFYFLLSLPFAIICLLILGKILVTVWDVVMGGHNPTDNERKKANKPADQRTRR